MLLSIMLLMRRTARVLGIILTMGRPPLPLSLSPTLDAQDQLVAINRIRRVKLGLGGAANQAVVLQEDFCHAVSSAKLTLPDLPNGSTAESDVARIKGE
jgi:hypothetical protein